MMKTSFDEALVWQPYYSILCFQLLPSIKKEEVSNVQIFLGWNPLSMCPQNAETTCISLKLNLLLLSCHDAIFSTCKHLISFFRALHFWTKTSTKANVCATELSIPAQMQVCSCDESLRFSMCSSWFVLLKRIITTHSKSLHKALKSLWFCFKLLKKKCAFWVVRQGVRLFSSGMLWTEVQIRPFHPKALCTSGFMKFFFTAKKISCSFVLWNRTYKGNSLFTRWSRAKLMGFGTKDFEEDSLTIPHAIT